MTEVILEPEVTIAGRPARGRHHENHEGHEVGPEELGHSLGERPLKDRVVDGAVNASGTIASETGHGLQPMQSGKVNQYGALLFGAAAVGAIVLVILNVS